MNSNLREPAVAAPTGVTAWLDDIAAGADPLVWLARARTAARDSLDLGLWIHLCPDQRWADQLALLQTRLAEPGTRAELMARYPLLGVPFGVKDNIDIAGAPTSAACPKFTRVAQRSATVVQRLLDAGALWLGKTNLDQFATGLVGTRSPYGQPACLSDASRISGGSSSGSAMVVARGIVTFALGTDTAGSGRIPAGFNGLVGLKPTPGRVSTAGVLPACRTLDCVSIFAHNVADAAHVLAVIEGPDAADAYSAWSPGPAALPAHRPLRVAVPKAPVLDAALGYPAAWAAALQHLSSFADVARQHGIDLVEVDMAKLDEVAALLYDGPWVAERHATVRELLERDPDALDPTVRQVIGRAIGQTATTTFEAQYHLRALQAELSGWWDHIDLLMVPTAPTHPTFAEVAADPLGANSRLGRYTNFVNLLGWSALALPAGEAAQRLPFGVTFIGPAQADAALANFGRLWEGTVGTERVKHAEGAEVTEGTNGTTVPTRQPASEATLALAVVGAHLSGLPLNWQLTERGARLIAVTHTAPVYQLYALPGTTPPKPGMVRVGRGDEELGTSIAVEVWAMPQREVGSFLALISAPLGLGSLQLADGSTVHGFVCEAHAVAAATNISHFGGWRAYLASLRATP